MSRYQRLVALLIKKTKEGTAGWQPTSRNGVFSLSLPDYGVLIAMTSEAPNQEDVQFQIINSSGTVIDKFTDVDVAADDPDKQTAYRDMATLYHDARRQALGVDKALDKLIEELEKP